MLPSDRINVRSRKVTGDKDGRLIPRKGNPSRPSSTRYSVCARRRSQNTEQPTAVRAGTRSSTRRGGFPLKPHPRRTDDPREDGGRSIQKHMESRSAPLIRKRQPTPTVPAPTCQKGVVRQGRTSPGQGVENGAPAHAGGGGCAATVGKCDVSSKKLKTATT